MRRVHMGEKMLLWLEFGKGRKPECCSRSGKSDGWVAHWAICRRDPSVLLEDLCISACETRPFDPSGWVITNICLCCPSLGWVGLGSSLLRVRLKNVDVGSRPTRLPGHMFGQSRYSPNVRGERLKLDYCNGAMLHWCSIAIVDYCYVAVLQWCNIAMVQYCNGAVLQ